jgi:hypothetical protein
MDQSLHNTLAGAYEIAEEFNSQIEAAKKAQVFELFGGYSSGPVNRVAG